MLILLWLVTIVLPASSKETYNEFLDINHLPGNKVHAVFTFTSTSETVNERHFDILPRPLVSILLNYDVEELHLTLTQGLWRDKLWGYSEHSAPPGGQFLVWFGGSEEDLEERWVNVRNSMSGITCASLGSLSSEDTISPKYSLKPTGLTTKQGNSTYMRYGVSPFEVVCTENMTPWLKLLPCGGRTGLASLLDASKMYDTAYHSMAIHTRRVESPDCAGPIWEIKQTLSLVFSPVQLTDRKDWSFRTLFGRTLVNSCPVAASTKVGIQLLESLDSMEISPPEYEIVSDRRIVYDALNITNYKILNIYCRYKNREITHESPDVVTPILAHTYISRISSSSSGHIVTIFTNSHSDPVKLLYLQMIPWYLRAYLHTLTLEQILPTPAPLAPEELAVKLAKDRSNPYTLETILTVPARSTLKFSIQFDPLLLRWNEYPPDAHHGRNIPSGILSFRHDEKVVRVYTETPLVYLPTPDFSMPFNVLCLVSTVIAIVYGSIFSLTTKDLVCIKETDVKQGLLLQLINAIRGALRKTDQKKGDKKVDEVAKVDEVTKVDDEVKVDDDAEVDEVCDKVEQPEDQANDNKPKETDKVGACQGLGG